MELGQKDYVMSTGMYFSVAGTYRINGVRYLPAVCYPLTGDLQKTIEVMQEKGAAKIHARFVRFPNGAEAAQRLDPPLPPPPPEDQEHSGGGEESSPEFE
jgi:hypothetical protein